VGVGLRTAIVLAAFAALAPLPAFAQAFNPFAPVVSTAPVVAPAVDLGRPLSASGGPWVLAETLFFSGGKVVSDYSWRDKLHGQAGQLYTAADLQSDAEALRALPAFNRVTPSVYEIKSDPIPAQYASISVSTNQVRVVFDVELKSSTAAAKPRLVTPPSAVSGLILTPTAYRGAGRHNTPGLGLDFNAAYFIGRLYGKNNYADSPAKTNYIDRLGLWTMTADGKMQLQSDSGWQPAVAVGGQATFVFRDSPQPTINTPAVSVKVNAKSTKILTDGYFVMSKNFRGVRTSLGMMQGNIGDLVGSMSEFLTPEALRFYNHEPNGTIVSSRSVPFGSVFYLLKPDYPIGFEVMKFNGSPESPILINMKLGRFLRLNFDLALLKFRGGYDLLGLFQFRFNQFPRN
jgi:hypothetical protein